MTAPAVMMRPTAAEMAAARDRTIPDVVGPGLRVLFSGINPSLYSAATGCHFARPGNRFWPALHASGFTASLLRPSEQRLLLSYGLGITNLVARATARADELTAAELRAGGVTLATLGRDGWRCRFSLCSGSRRIGPRSARLALWSVRKRRASAGRRCGCCRIRAA